MNSIELKTIRELSPQARTANTTMNRRTALLTTALALLGCKKNKPSVSVEPTIATTPVITPKKINSSTIIAELNEIVSKLPGKPKINYYSPGEHSKYVVIIADKHKYNSGGRMQVNPELKPDLDTVHANTVRIIESLQTSLGNPASALFLEGDVTPNDEDKAEARKRLNKEVNHLIGDLDMSSKQAVVIRSSAYTILASEKEETTIKTLLLQLVRAYAETGGDLSNRRVLQLLNFIMGKFIKSDGYPDEAKIANYNNAVKKLLNEAPSNTFKLVEIPASGKNFKTTLLTLGIKSQTGVDFIKTKLKENLIDREANTVAAVEASTAPNHYSLMLRGGEHVDKSPGSNYGGLIEMFEEKGFGVIVVDPSGTVL